MSTLGIYIQVPFCQTKCTYCNFHTGVVSTDRFAPYIQAVQDEISCARGLYQSAGVVAPEGFDWQSIRSAMNRRPSADTLYIGGGTPSLLKPELLTGLLLRIQDCFSCNLKEVTLEADPETIERERADIWATYGINRISFGSQSFIDEELKAAGRMHRAADIYKAVPILRNAGISNISFDLLPGSQSRHMSHGAIRSVNPSPSLLNIFLFI